MARSVVVLPQRTLRTVFVLEVTAIRNGPVNSSSDSPSRDDVARMSTSVAASLTRRWAEIVKTDFDLLSLIAEDVVIYGAESE